jgi:hypothetical protein
MVYQYNSKEAEMLTDTESKMQAGTTARTLSPVLAAELAIAWGQKLPIIQQRGLSWADRSERGLPAPQVDPESILIWTADVLQMPVRYVKPREQVGRFVIVDYQPLSQPDPDIILALMPGAQAFHRAILDFQRARARHSETWSSWYLRVKETARRVLLPLRLLEPHPLEADFVIRWLLLVCAKGQTVQQAEGPGNLWDGR